MESGAKFVFDNFDDAIALAKSNPSYQKVLPLIYAERAKLKRITQTGTMYDYFLKFKGGAHAHVAEFAFLTPHGVKPNEEMADYLAANFTSELLNRMTPADLKEGEPYTEGHISVLFGVSTWSGMRKNNASNTLVLVSFHDNPLYSDGGPDAVYNTVALCPNCHKRMHIVKDKKDVKALIKKIREHLKDRDDSASLAKWEKLF